MFSRKNVSQEVLAAHVAAEESKEKALEDLAQAEQALREDLPVIQALKAHNERNHYDEFLRSLTAGAVK